MSAPISKNQKNIPILASELNISPQEEQSLFEQYMIMMEMATAESKARAQKQWEENKKKFIKEARHKMWAHIYRSEIRIKRKTEL